MNPRAVEEEASEENDEEPSVEEVESQLGRDLRSYGKSIVGVPFGVIVMVVAAFENNLRYVYVGLALVVLSLLLALWSRQDIQKDAQRIEETQFRKR